eukprot:1301691-Pleurochrysis_carterae.AAC.1
MGAPQLLHGKRAGADFFQFPYDARVDYTASEKVLPNNQRGVTKHPSEIADAAESLNGAQIGEEWLDQVRQVSDIVSRSVSRLPTDYVDLASRGHHFGRGVCEVVSICDRTDDKPGTPCTGANGERGYCFERRADEAAVNRLMCGRMLSLNNEYFQHPIALQHPDHVATGELLRCPRHADISELGSFEVVRLLIGGCMDPTDAGSFDPLAEVHVPSMCSTTQGTGISVKGCMFPGAENFNRTAREPGRCRCVADPAGDERRVEASRILWYEAAVWLLALCVEPSFLTNACGKCEGGEVLASGDSMDMGRSCMRFLKKAESADECCVTGLWRMKARSIARDGMFHPRVIPNKRPHAQRQSKRRSWQATFMASDVHNLVVHGYR